MRIRLGRRRLSLGAVVLLLALLALLRGPRLLDDLFRPEPRPREGWYTVARVVDGDTLVVSPSPNPASSEGDRIRLLGVDTPETVHPNQPQAPLSRRFAVAPRPRAMRTRFLESGRKTV